MNIHELRIVIIDIPSSRKPHSAIITYNVQKSICHSSPTSNPVFMGTGNSRLIDFLDVLEMYFHLTQSSAISKWLVYSVRLPEIV